MRRPVQIRVNGPQLASARKAFAAIRDMGADPTELLDLWGITLEASMRRRFDTGQGPGGIPWPVSRRAQHDGGKTLHDKGNLENSLRYEVRPHELEVGVDGVGRSAKFAYVHQFGATIVPRNAGALRFPIPGGGYVVTQKVTIPRRPIVGVDAEDKRDMKEVALEHLRSLTSGRP